MHAYLVLLNHPLPLAPTAGAHMIAALCDLCCTKCSGSPGRPRRGTANAALPLRVHWGIRRCFLQLDYSARLGAGWAGLCLCTTGAKRNYRGACARKTTGGLLHSLAARSTHQYQAPFCGSSSDPLAPHPLHPFPVLRPGCHDRARPAAAAEPPQPPGGHAPARQDTRMRAVQVRVCARACVWPHRLSLAPRPGQPLLLRRRAPGTCSRPPPPPPLVDYCHARRLAASPPWPPPPLLPRSLLPRPLPLLLPRTLPPPPPRHTPPPPQQQPALVAFLAGRQQHARPGRPARGAVLHQGVHAAVPGGRLLLRHGVCKGRGHRQ